VLGLSASVQRDKFPISRRSRSNFFERGIRERAEASTIHRFQEGNLVRVIVPTGRGKHRGAVVVLDIYPRFIDFEHGRRRFRLRNFRDLNPLEYPIKSIYLIICVLMTLTILLAPPGLDLSRETAVNSSRELGEAAQRVAGRDYRPVYLSTGSVEIQSVVNHFNQMSVSWRNPNATCAKPTDIWGVLSTISTGVISLDVNEVITMVNRHATKLFRITG